MLLAASPALAQAPLTAAAFDNAAHPTAPTAPLLHPAPGAPSPGLAELPTAQAWKDANHAVGEFPRGHADIVRWKARQGSEPALQPASHAERAPKSKPFHGHPPAHGQNRDHSKHRGPHATHGGKP